MYAPRNNAAATMRPTLTNLFVELISNAGDTRLRAAADHARRRRLRCGDPRSINIRVIAANSVTFAAATNRLKGDATQRPDQSWTGGATKKRLSANVAEIGK